MSAHLITAGWTEEATRPHRNLPLRLRVRRHPLYWRLRLFFNPIYGRYLRLKDYRYYRRRAKLVVIQCPTCGADYRARDLFDCLCHGCRMDWRGNTEVLAGKLMNRFGVLD